MSFKIDIALDLSKLWIILINSLLTMKSNSMDLESAKAAAKRLFQKVNFTGGPLQSYEISSLLTDTYEYLKLRIPSNMQPTNQTPKISRCTLKSSTPTETDRSLWKISKAKQYNISVDQESSKELQAKPTLPLQSTAPVEYLVDLIAKVKLKVPSPPRRMYPQIMATINSQCHQRISLTFINIQLDHQPLKNNPISLHNAITVTKLYTTFHWPSKSSKNMQHNTAQSLNKECQVCSLTLTMSWEEKGTTPVARTSGPGWSYAIRIKMAMFSFSSIVILCSDSWKKLATRSTNDILKHICIESTSIIYRQYNDEHNWPIFDKKTY